MKNNTKLITVISTAAIALSLSVPAAVSVSAAQNVSSTPASFTKASNDWSNVDDWTPEQISDFLSTPKKTNFDTAIPSGDVETNQLTKYVTVKNNQFILTLPSKVNVSPEIIAKAKDELNASNKVIAESGLTINPTTLVAEKIVSVNPGDIQVRSYGKTGILKVGWNYARVGLDAGLVKDILIGGVSGAAGYLGFIVSGPGAAAIVAAVAGIAGNHVGNIKNGVWFDYNIFTRGITHIGWQ